MPYELLAELSVATPSKIVLLVMDGLGGLPRPETGLTELATASKTHLNALARDSVTGLSQPIVPGITPGSGPAHLALFGYDPIACNVGRGVLSALGIGFPLGATDLAARINFATVDDQGRVTDRRAGRISTETNRELVGLLRQIRIPGVDIFLETESMHRAVVVFRAPNLRADISDTDPQHTGVLPHRVIAHHPEAELTAAIVNQFIGEAGRILADQSPANFVLLRGFATYPKLPSLSDLYKLRPAAVATYPMYRGLGRLVGMDVLETGETFEDEVRTIVENWDRYDFFFVHYKYTDTTGEDGNFEAKVAAIEEVDRSLPLLLSLKPNVICVTGDHSTPSRLREHSWNPVPFLLRGAYEIPDDVEEFTEKACQKGTLGRFPAQQAMLLMMGNARKLEKFGA
ncbi:MAG TPA: 2,3-bisphosphoglycerate-independent phosphoglycerate mutase [Chloroflexota bacterium]|nr:2,3-bisphosphoglycerate-independent phosphoglycerate mutase [Chloroflexota bacterium]